MAKRMRRATLTVGGVVTGVRDVKMTDQSEWNGDRADNEASGDFVRMTEGPYDLGFELLARHASVATGYKQTVVITGKEVTITAGAEVLADKTWTLSDGYLVVDADLPTENPGRLPVRGQFKTMVIA